MYIAPNSTVQLFTDVPLEANYINTLSWNNIGAQNTYFGSKLYKTYDETTYLKATVNYIDVEYTVDETLMHCNYMRFKNTSFEDKWFYAFITNISYVNNVTTRLTYTIDVMQTWYFDYTLNSVLVVREHSETDEIGSNLQPEGLETGEYIYAKSEKIADTYMNDYGYVIMASQSPTGSQNYNHFANQVSVLYIKICYDETEFVSELNAFLAGITKSLEPIIAIYQVPKLFLGRRNSDTPTYTGQATGIVYLPIALDYFKPTYNPTNVSINYIPKNKKLFTYPYNFITLVLPDGTTQQYRYEYFKGSNTDPESYKIAIECVIMPKPECAFIPMDYKGEEYCYPFAVTYDGFPTIGVASDAFSAWWAQNKSSYVSGINENLIDTVMAASDIGAAIYDGNNYFGYGTKPDGSTYPYRDYQGAGAKLGTMVNTLASDLRRATFETAAEVSAIYSDIKDSATGVLNEIRAKQNHKAVPDAVVTSATGKGLVTAFQRNTAIAYCTQISAEYARVIDDYFTRYGYATNQIKVPNLYSRPYWNYIKTASCTINTNIPAEYEDAICKIYDNGITFWHSPNMVGDYRANNSPI